MAQHHLNGADIRTPLQEVGGKGMAQSVRGNLLLIRALRAYSEPSAKTIAREGTAESPTKR